MEASAEKEGDDPMAEQGRALTSRVGPLEIDWPASVGYFGGLAAAVAFEIIAPPVGLVLAAVPLVSGLKQEWAPPPLRVVGRVLEGLSRPVGGGSRVGLRFVDPDHSAGDAASTGP